MTLIWFVGKKNSVDLRRSRVASVNAQRFNNNDMIERKEVNWKALVEYSRWESDEEEENSKHDGKDEQLAE